MRHGISAFALSLLLPSLALSLPSPSVAKRAPAASETQSVSGRCTGHSRITQLHAQAGASDKSTTFVCDNELVTYQDAKRQHVVLEYGVRGGKKGSKVVGFDGIIDWTDGEFASVKILQMYLVRGELHPAENTSCSLQLVGGTVTKAQCYATMREGKNRWEALIDFGPAAKGQ